jgi:hypothetical protein
VSRTLPAAEEIVSLARSRALVPSDLLALASDRLPLDRERELPFARPRVRLVDFLLPVVALLEALLLFEAERDRDRSAPAEDWVLSSLPLFVAREDPGPPALPLDCGEALRELAALRCVDVGIS